MTKFVTLKLLLVSASFFIITVTLAQRNATLFIDGQEVKTVSANSASDSMPVKSKNWMSVTYVKCLQEKLPCECQKMETHTLIRLDSSYATIHDGIIYDPNTFPLKKIGDNIYQVFRTQYIPALFQDSTIIMGILQIVSDTLYYYDNYSNTKIAYINYGSAGDNDWAYDKEHIRLLDKAFDMRNYPSLEKILNNDSISCNCNPELGVINLISSKGNGWILEQKNGYLFIYKWTNIPKEKVGDLKIEKQLLKSYKW